MINHRNDNVNTIERELFKALCKIGSVSCDNADSLQKIGFMRAARTDKGVHALGQVVSFKMIPNPPCLQECLQRQDNHPGDQTANSICSSSSCSVATDIDPLDVDLAMQPQNRQRLIQLINNELPEDIRVWGYQRTMNNFHSKNACDARQYEYVMPSYILDPEEGELELIGQELSEEAKEDLLQMMRGKQRQKQSLADVDVESKKISNGGYNNGEGDGDEEDDEGAADADTDGEDEDIVDRAGGMEYSDWLTQIRQHCLQTDRKQRHLAYRLSADKLAKVRAVCSTFMGTRNFHNFTIGRPNWDRSANRFIMTFECSDPFVRDGMEWLSFRIIGQSFMLHQIRKMIAMVILMVRLDRPLALLEQSFEQYRFPIPKAPSLGLFLVAPIYNAYNTQVDKLRKQNPTGFSAEKVSFEPFAEELDQFKEKMIYSRIFEEERRDSTFDVWFSCIRGRPEQVAYMTPDGSVSQFYAQLAKEGIYDPERHAKSRRVKSITRKRTSGKVKDLDKRQKSLKPLKPPMCE